MTIIDTFLLNMPFLYVFLRENAYFRSKMANFLKCYFTLIKKW